MAQSLSLAELSKLYSNARKAPSALGENLEGGTTKEKLTKLYFTRESSSLFATPSGLATLVPLSEQKTIAICLVIVDSLHHEEIWRHWIEQGDAEGSKYKARLFVHAKYPEKVQSEWVRRHCLPLSYMPEWNSPEVIRSMLAVLDAALEDPHCGRIVFGTESCLPLYNLSEVAEMLFRENKSWLDAFHEGKSNWERSACFASVDDRVVPPKAVWKSIPGWIMLTRTHAAEVHVLTKQSLFLDSRSNAEATVLQPLKASLPAEPSPGILGSGSEADLVRAWGTGAWSEDKPGVFAPEEVFFPTVLSLLGYLRRNTNDQVKRQMVTFARWKKVGDANPVSYSEFTNSLCAEFRGTGAAFGRKFEKGVSLAQWQAVVSELSGARQHITGAKRPREEDRDNATNARKK